MPPKSNLRALLDARKAPTRVLGPIERHLMTQPPDTSRRTDVLHPSEIVKKDWCLRGSWFLLNGYEPKPRALNLRSHRIFGTGHATHDWYQEQLGDMGVLWGLWQCMACKRVEPEMSLKPLHHCMMCGQQMWKYAEVPVVNESIRLEGSTDGWVKGLGPDFLIEAKTVGEGTIRTHAPELLSKENRSVAQAFAKIRRPFPEHFKQGQTYLDCLHRSYGDSAPDEVVFIYECKDNGDTKEFVVARDRESIAPILDKAEELMRFIKQDKIPPCSNGADEGCRQCSPFKEAA